MAGWEVEVERYGFDRNLLSIRYVDVGSPEKPQEEGHESAFSEAYVSSQR